MIILGIGLALFFIFDLDAYISPNTLRNNREWILTQVSEHAVLAALVFMAVYATAVIFSLPTGAILTITGGFAFGQILGTLYAVTSATIGATCLFLIAQTSFGDFLRSKAGPPIKSMQKKFQSNELNYLLMLRWIPIFPFFMVNVVPAFLGVSLRSYIIGTFFGIIPGSFLYVTIGAGVGSIFDQGKSMELKNLLAEEIIAALIGLLVLVSMPVFYRKVKNHKGTIENE